MVGLLKINREIDCYLYLNGELKKMGERIKGSWDKYIMNPSELKE